MKKTVAILFLCVCIGISTGCGEKKKEETKVVECTQTQSLSAYEIKSNFKITAKGEVVEKVEATETYTSEDASIIDQLEQTLNLQYESLNSSYGGYTHKVTKGEKQVSASVTIDYSKFDSKKFATDKKLEDYIKNDHLTLDGVIKRYQLNGATCK